MVHNYSVIVVLHAIVHGYNAQVLVTAIAFNSLNNYFIGSEQRRSNFMDDVEPVHAQLMSLKRQFVSYYLDFNLI